MGELFEVKNRIYDLAVEMRDRDDAAKTLPARELIVTAADKLAEAWNALAKLPRE